MFGLPIEIISAKYSEYRKKYNTDSLLGVTYFRAFIMLLVGFLSTQLGYAPSERIMQIWMYAVCVPVFLSLFAMAVALLHALIYWVCRLAGVAYTSSSLSHFFEKILRYVFPQKIYTSSFFVGPERSIPQRGIYFGTILLVLFVIVGCMMCVLWSMHSGRLEFPSVILEIIRVFSHL